MKYYCYSYNSFEFCRDNILFTMRCELTNKIRPNILESMIGKSEYNSFTFSNYNMLYRLYVHGISSRLL